MPRKHVVAVLFVIFAQLLAIQRTSAQTTCDLTPQMQPVVAELRGLPFRQPVDTGTQTVAELQEVLQHELDRTYPGETLTHLEKRLFKFGFVASPINLREMLNRLLSQQIAGYYDPHQKKMVLIESTSAAPAQQPLFPIETFSQMLLQNAGVSLDQILLSHELTHVLQDQHFHLLALPFEALDPEDTTSAVKALIEGDAMLVMMDYMLREQGTDMAATPKLSQVLHEWVNSPLVKGFGPFRTIPRYLMDNLFFSYVAGLDFVLRLKQDGGWERVNQAYQQIPVSTEQILHPEKYLVCPDLPTTLVLPPLPAAITGWRLLEQNTLGELNISILLDGYLPTPQAQQASAGWDGDRFGLYEQPDTGKLLLVWVTVWDSGPEAQEFFETYAAALERRYNSPSHPLKSDSPESVNAVSWNLATGDVVLERRGPNVMFCDGIPPELSEDFLVWRQTIRPAEAQ